MKQCRFCGRRLENPASKLTCSECRFLVAVRSARAELDRMIGSYVEREKWRPSVSRPGRVLKVDGELFYVERIQEEAKR